MKFYHISDPKNIPSILKKGLTLNAEGQLFIFNDLKFSCSIAYDQCGLTNYAIFEIKIPPKNIVSDNVGEFSGKSQFICSSAISPKDLNFLGCKKITIS